MIVTRLEIEYSLPFCFDCFRKLRLLFGRKVVPGYLVGVPSTEIKFSMQWARLGRRNRKGSVFLAFSDAEASSLPCLLDVHRSFSHGRHPSSVLVTLHRHSVVALQLDHCLQQLHSPGELGRACFGGMKRNHGFTCLSSSWYFPTRFLHRLRSEDASGWCLGELTLSCRTGSNLHVRAA